MHHVDMEEWQLIYWKRGLDSHGDLVQYMWCHKIGEKSQKLLNRVISYRVRILDFTLRTK